jgi:hypothetical protein
MAMRKAISLMIAVIMLAGCTSVGTLGIVTRSTGDPGSLLRNPTQYKELGVVEGEACRYFLLAIVPWGDATLTTAVDQALATVGGDAMINVTVTNSLYGFIPIYNVFTYSCTSVRGIAIRIKKEEPVIKQNSSGQK